VPVDAGSIYSEVRISLDKLQGDIRHAQTAMNSLGPVSKTVGQTVQRNWTQAFNQIKIISAAAFAAVALAIKSAVSTFADFEQSLANVQSVARATPEEFENIEEAAKHMGETTRFTASQAADAMYYLASAGFDANQSIAALDGVLNLAGATQSDLAFTSAAVAASISQFSLEAEDSERVANVFTAAIQNSQATMEKLATSMKNLGPVASGMGYDIEETAGMLQILYNAGLDASTAGTALRRVLGDLANATSPAIAKLEAMGVSFDQVNPLANDFASILDAMNEVGVDAGEAMAIFGQRAGPAMIKLLQAGGDEVRDYTDAVRGTNAAAEAYAVQNDTLSGSFDRLKSATEGAKISFVENIAPILRGLVDIATKLVGWIGKLPGPIQLFVGILAAGVPTVLAAGSAIAFMSTALAGAGIALGAILGPITLIVGGVAAAAAGIAAFSGKLRENRRAAEEATRAGAEYRQELVEQAKAVRELTNEEEIALLTQQKANVERQLTGTNLAMLYSLYRRTGQAAADLIDPLLEQARLETRLAQVRGENAEEAARSEFDLLVQFRQQLREKENLTGAELALTLAIQRRINVLDELLRSLGIVADESERVNEEAETLADKLALLEQRYAVFGDEIDITKEKADLYREAINKLLEEGTDPQNAALGELIEKYRVLQALLGEGEDQDARIAEIMSDLNDGLASAASEAEVFGSEVDLNTRQQQAYQAAIRSLINEGLDPQGETISGLAAKYRDLRGAAEAASEREAALRQKVLEKEQERAEAARLADEQEQAREKQADETKQRKIEQMEEEARLQAEAEQQAEDRAKTEERAATAVSDALDSYGLKLAELEGDEEALRQAERNRVAETLRSAGVSEDAIDDVIAKVREYQDTLADSEATEEFADAIKQATDLAFSYFDQLGNLVLDILDTVTERRLAAIDATLQAELEANDAALRAELEANGVAEETRLERYQRQLEEAIETGDEERAAELEDAIQRLQIQQEYAAERQTIIEEHEREKAQIEYEAALSAWRMQVAMTVAQTFQAAVNAYSSAAAIPVLGTVLAPIAAAAASAFGIAQVALMRESKPEPPQLATGGIVLPQQNGVPTVQAENGYPELSLNGGPEGRALLRQFAQEIAAESGAGSLTAILEIDGLQVARAVADRMNNGQVRLRL